MLQHRAVYPATLELLKELMLLPELTGFFLVGGTSLALQLGHRVSVDLDLFTEKNFNTEELCNCLKKKFIINDITQFKDTLNIKIEYPANSKNNIKIDFIRYAYPLINEISEKEGIRLISIEDIIPMKLSAIAGRGSKKDFYDIYFLLNIFSLSKMFELFKMKFPQTNQFHILKSLTYFEDAEIEPNPILLSIISWQKVKSKIIKEVRLFVRK